MKLYFLLSTLLVVINGLRSKRQAIIFGPAPASKFDCTTPDNKEGSCIRLFDCKPLYTKLRSSNPPPEFINFLRKSVCRYENNVPIVCCADVEKKATSKPTPFVLSTGTTKPVQPQTSPIPVTTNEPIEPQTTIFTEPPTEPPASESKMRGFDLLPPECGNSTRTTTRIVGGRIAEKGSWPWLGALGYRSFNDKLDFLCGGALITKRHILTAAHCVHRRNDLELVRMGEHDLNSEEETQHVDYVIEKKKIHESYDNSNFGNDIAILTLDRPVDFKAEVSPVCLPQDKFYKNNTLAGIQAFVAGWGSIAYNNVSSPVLKEAMLPIRTNKDCSEGYKAFRSVNIDSKRLCAGVGGNDACQGDSGGPLMVYNPFERKYGVIGVVSVGFRCAEAEFPGIYTRVTEYLDWIENNLD